MRKTAALLAAAALARGAIADYQPPMKNPVTDYDRQLVAAAVALPSAPSFGEGDWLLVVSTRDQRLAAARMAGGAFEVVAVYTVSTARAGVGAEADSGKTPPGWHRVAEWIGGDAVPGQVFVSRRPTEEIIPYPDWRSDLSADKVLTRIMWLDGLEPGRNKGPGVDSHDRFIYLHGTNQEHLLGQPASHGCIRLFNRDVMELYAFTEGHPAYCLVLR